MMDSSILLLLAACGGTGEDTTTPAAAPDLTEALGPGEVRAGVVTDEAALFGGGSAEGRAGDVKIYNSLVRFVVQGARDDGDYYTTYGGNLIDADLVRPEGVPGQDLLDEYFPMVGLARVPRAETVEVVADGSDGEAAVVRVEAKGAPLTLATGALENDDIVPDVDVDIVVEYRLEPDSRLLRVTTTATWHGSATSLSPGDLALVGLEVADDWGPGRGLSEDGDAPWIAAVERHDALVLGLLPDGDAFEPSALADVLNSVGPIMSAFQPTVEVDEGTTVSWSTWVGVGEDPAALTREWLERRGVETTELGGTVTAGGAPVAGARVHVLDADGAPVTIAYTDEDGRWSAWVPADGGPYRAVATGRGQAIFPDLPEGAGRYGPYAAGWLREQALDTLENGAEPAAPFAEGYGVSEEVEASVDTELELVPPAWLHVEVADGLPAVVRVDFAEGDPVSRDPRTTPKRPEGAAAYGYARDGDLDLPVEPGHYRVVVHRGLRWEPHVEEVTVGSGDEVVVQAELGEAWSADGVLSFDPHVHAAPSSDGGIPMSERLVGHAAHGVDVHVGTDHDHVADYRPLLAPLGLDGVLASVVSDEVSPPMRGHVNIYPLEPDPDLPNAGAPRWWEAGFADTTEYLAALRERVGDGIVQVNHPLGGSGLVDRAGYVDGVVTEPDRWSDDFDAMEVVNGGEWEDYFPLYLDMVSRGLVPTPTGVSDAHHHGKDAGNNVTWALVGASSAADLDLDAMKEAFHAHRTVASHGPYIEATIDGEWAPGRTVTGRPEVEVAVLAPSWVQVDRLEVWRDTELVEEIEVPDPSASGEKLRTTISLDPAATGEDRDAAFTLVARGDADMDPVYPGRTPWAMAAAILVDVDGDGWTPPLPSISVEGRR